MNSKLKHSLSNRENISILSVIIIILAIAAGMWVDNNKGPAKETISQGSSAVIGNLLGIDLNGPYWKHNNIAVNIICDTSPCSESISVDSVRKGVENLEQKLIEKTGNAKGWNFVINLVDPNAMTAKNILASQINSVELTPDDAIAIMIVDKDSENPGSDTCIDYYGDYINDYASSEYIVSGISKSFIHICKSTDSEENSDETISGTTSHELLHALGVGHSNIPDNDMCSVEELPNGEGKKVLIDTCPGANLNPSMTPISDNSINSLLKMYPCGFACRDDDSKYPMFLPDGSNQRGSGITFVGLKQCIDSDKTCVDKTNSALTCLAEDDTKTEVIECDHELINTALDYNLAIIVVETSWVLKLVNDLFLVIWSIIF